MIENSTISERRQESRRLSATRYGGRRVLDIRKNLEQVGTQGHQVVWTCLIAISLALASIYKVSHPLTDSRFMRERGIASESTPKVDLINRSKSGYSESKANEHQPKMVRN